MISSHKKFGKKKKEGNTQTIFLSDQFTIILPQNLGISMNRTLYMQIVHIQRTWT